MAGVTTGRPRRGFTGIRDMGKGRLNLSKYWIKGMRQRVFHYWCYACEHEFESPLHYEACYLCDSDYMGIQELGGKHGDFVKGDSLRGKLCQTKK